MTASLQLNFGLDGGYKERPTKKQLEELPLKNIKFFSTHNTFILNKQFGGLLSYRTVIEQIKAARYMPVCIELDISVYSNKKKYTMDIFLDHFTSEFEKFKIPSSNEPSPEKPNLEEPSPENNRLNTNIVIEGEKYNPNIIKAERFLSDKKDYNYFKCYNLKYHGELLIEYEIGVVFDKILTLIKYYGIEQNIPNLFPIVLNIDVGHSNKLLINDIIEKYNTKFTEFSANNSVDNIANGIIYETGDTININETKLKSLMGKVLLRHYDKKTNQKSHIKKKGKSTPIILQSNYNISSMPDNPIKEDISRFYPDFSIHGKTSLKNHEKIKALKEVIRIKRGNKRCKYKIKKGYTAVPKIMTKKGGIISCTIFRKYGECSSYKYLNKLILQNIYGPNNYNMVAFNYTDVDEVLVKKLIEDFKTLYSSYYTPTTEPTPIPIRTTEPTPIPVFGGYKEPKKKRKTIKRQNKNKKNKHQNTKKIKNNNKTKKIINKNNKSNKKNVTKRGGKL
jgi:hypothetical protein